MAICKFCGVAFAWGISDGKFVPLIPVGEEGELARDYQDENGTLRSGHRSICTLRGGPTVRVSRLARSVAAEDILPSPPAAAPVDPGTGEVLTEPPVKKRRERKRGWAVTAGLGLFGKKQGE